MRADAQGGASPRLHEPSRPPTWGLRRRHIWWNGAPTRDSWRRLAFAALARLRFDSVLLALHRRRAGFIILNIHNVSPKPNAFWPGLAPHDFDAVVTYLNQHFSIRTLGELDQQDADPRPRMVLSFDDGYLDFVEHAMPLLARHGIRVNQNVIGSAVVTGSPPWNIQMYDMLVNAPLPLLQQLRLPGFSFKLTRDSALGRARFGATLSAHFKSRSRAAREPLVAEFVYQLREVEVRHPTRMMRAAHVAAACAAGHEIGCHSYSHESMAYESTAFFEEDFLRSSDLFRQLEIPLTIYAFPNGSHRREQVSFLKAAGVRHVLVVDDRLVRGSERAVLPRVTLWGQSAAEIRLRAVGLRAKWS